MRSFLAFVPFAVVALAAGCSSSSSSPAATGDDGTGAEGGAGGEGGATNPNLTSVSYQMQETVPGGGEEFKCQYVQLPNVPGWMVQSKHDYTPGSHHMLLYTTALTAIPAGGDQVTDCYEGTGNNIMSDATGVLYGGQTPTGEEVMPAGAGLPTQANEVLIFQTHYLNASASPLQATVNVTLTLDTNSSDIQTYAGLIFFYDPFIDVPPGATAKAQMRCSIPSDITLLYGSSHYHSRGVGYVRVPRPGGRSAGGDALLHFDELVEPDERAAQHGRPGRIAHPLRVRLRQLGGDLGVLRRPERADQRDVHVHRALLPGDGQGRGLLCHVVP